MTVRTKNMELPAQTRQAEVRKSSLDVEARTVEVVVSTGAMVKRYSWFGEYDEELVIDEQALDLRRLNTIAPVLDNHNSYGSVRNTLGAVVRGSGRIEAGQLLATLRFAKTPAGDEVMQLIGDDILRAVSVGYDAEYEEIRAKDRTDGGDRMLLRAVRWEPFEVSAVMMPADMGATIRSRADWPGPTRRYAVRNREETDMSEKNAPVNPGPTLDEAAEALRVCDERAEKAVFERLSVARAAAKIAGIDDEEKIALVAREYRTADAIKARFVDLAEEAQRNQMPTSPHVTMGRDSGDQVSDLLRGAILARALQGVDPNKIAAHNKRADDERKNGLLNLDKIERPTDRDMVRTGRKKLTELAEMFLESRGINTRSMNPNDIAGTALAYRSGTGTLATTADFSGILGNAANKMLWAGYAEVESQWRELIGVRKDTPDFKQFSIYRRSAAPDIEYVNEHGEVKRASYNVTTPLTGQLRTAGIEVGFTRQMLINDDLNAFTEQSLGLGDSARRFEDDFVMSTLLVGNPILADGVALFAAGRGNLSTDVGAPDLAAINEVARLFAVMTETVKKAGNNAGSQSRKISQDVGGFIGAFSEALTINQLLRPEGYTPTSASAALPDFLRGLNAYRDVRLNVETSSPDVWFAFAKNRKAIAYGHLEGEGAPRFAQFQAAHVDGVIFQLLNDWYGAVADPYALVRVPKS